MEIIRANLADTLGLKRISDIPIPFELKNAHMFYIDDEDACATHAERKRI